MNGENEYIDKLFRQKIDGQIELPSFISWNKNKGWGKYIQNYLPSYLTHRKRLFMAAAALAILIISASILFILHNYNEQELCSFDGSDKLVKEIVLKGDHHCYLAPESKIQFCRSNKISQADTLYLEGEGYFETSNVKPLVIIAKNTITKCYGAKIDIKSVKSLKYTTISSLSGNIVTQCPDNNFPEMYINPNEKCLIYEGGIYASKEVNDDPNFLAWKTGTLTFNNIPLSVAIKTIEDFYGVTIEVKSKDVRYCRITSEFEKTNINDVLKYIQDSYKTKIRKFDNTIILEDGICK
jgi:transmembrane sensor